MNCKAVEDRDCCGASNRTRESELERLHYQWEALKLEHVRVVAEQQRTNSEAIVRFADVAIRSLLVLNGGAALATIGFAAQAISAKRAVLALEDVVFWFGVGASLAVLCAGSAYVTQRFSQLIDPESGRHHGAFVVLNFLAAAIWVLGLACFVYSVVLSSVAQQTTRLEAFT